MNFLTQPWVRSLNPGTETYPFESMRGMKMILAYKRDAMFLDPGILNQDNKLDGEGPYRLVPPQKNPGPPEIRPALL